jgi:dipeptidyl aminopeptidase/acylaminoacyl peptidase
MGDFSPSGRRLTIFRLREGRLSLGVADRSKSHDKLAPFTPDLPIASPSPIWLDEGRLILVALPEGELPTLLAFGEATQKRSRLLWHIAAEGQQPSATLTGSGRFKDAGLGDSHRSVILLDIASKQSRTLFRGEASDIALSADRTRSPCCSRPRPIHTVAERELDAGTNWRRRGLAVVDVRDGTEWNVCQGCDVAPNLLAWSPAGAELLYFAARPGSSWREGELYRLDARRGTIRPLTGPGLRAAVQSPDRNSVVVNAGWAGRTPVALLKPGSGGQRADWFAIPDPASARNLSAFLPGSAGSLVAATPSEVALASNGSIWRVPLAGPPTKLKTGNIAAVGPSTPDRFSVGARHIFNPAAREMPLLVEKAEGAAMLRFVAASPAGDRRCPLPSADMSVLAADPASGTAILFDQQGGGMGRLLRLSCNGDIEAIDSINRQLADVEAVAPIAVRSRGAGGDVLTHWLYLPKRPAAFPPPLVVIPYPGTVYPDAAPPPPDLSQMKSVINEQLLAAHGYAVLRPSIPLAWSTGDPLLTFPGLVLGAVDAGRRHREGGRHTAGGPRPQLRRLCRSGPRHPKRAVPRRHCLSRDLRPDSGLRHWGGCRRGRAARPPFTRNRGGLARGRPGTDGPPAVARPPALRSQQPDLRGRGIKAPILLIHGEVDPLASSHAERMFFALHRLGKDAKMLRYFGEGHVLASPANIRDHWRRVFDFLDDRCRDPGLPQAELRYRPQCRAQARSWRREQAAAPCRSTSRPARRGARRAPSALSSPLATSAPSSR